MIRMQGVVKTYPGRGGQAPQRVLKGVDLRVRPGEYVAFVGASGSGKSTLMHILGCLDTPTGGRYLLDGEDVSRLDAKALCRVRREKIGFVFQGYQLLSKLTAADNVPPRRWRAWVWPDAGRAVPASSAAGSSSGWPWRGRCVIRPGCFCATSPPARWMWTAAMSFWTCLTSCT